MSNEEKILQILSEMQTDMKEVKGRLDRLQTDMTGLKEDVAELKEAHEITRDGVNALLEWSDKISEAQRLPLPKI